MEMTVPGVYRIAFMEVNAYLVGEPGGPWAVVDTGTPGKFEAIRAAAAERFGKASRPEAIYLTHGHPDHVGSALDLATYWDVPVYAHRMELPYITGKSEYPPLDPTTGGAIAILGRFLKIPTVNLGDTVGPLPEGDLPGLPGWQAVESPGHAPGHVAFFRAADRTLLAGDACATVDLDKFEAVLTNAQKLVRPGSPGTPNWVLARKSLKRLAELRPLTVACGHGIPMSGPEMPEKLKSVAEEFIIPLKGRYVSDPARWDENGVTYLPPAPTDNLPKKAAVVLGAAAAFGIGIFLARRVQDRKRKGGRR